MADRFEDSYAGQLRALVGARLLKLPGACVLIQSDKGEILLERSVGREDYRLIGGLAEARESMEQCARREIMEETGLTLGQLTPYGFGDNPAYIGALPNGHVMHSLTMLFFTNSYSGDLVLDTEEIAQCGWFPWDALPDNLSPRTRDFIRAYLRFRETGDFQLV